MASVVISGDTSGSVTLSAPAVAGTTTLTLPSTSGTVLTTASTTGISGSAISTGTVAEAYGGTGTNTGYYGFKNRIINGAMVIDQRNAGASVTTSGGNNFDPDRWIVYDAVGSKMSVQRVADAPSGFTYSQKITSLAATTPGSTDYYFDCQRIEGFNVADLAWGTASAATVTLSFWVKSSLTGSFSGAFGNASFSRSYPFSYTISAANTWEQKTITVSGDTTGTWATDNSTGLQVVFDLGSGTSRAGTANTWSANDYRKVTGSVNLIGTNAATLYITGVQLEKGSTATSFDYRPYGTELALCQRYFEKSYNIGTVPGTNTTTGIAGYIVMANTTTSLANNGTNAVVFKVYKRTTPTITTYDSVGNSGKLSYAPAGMGRQDNITSVVHRQAEGGFGVYTTSASSLTTGQAVEQFHQWTADAEL